MNGTFDDTAVHRDLPPIWQVLRAVSGLVAVHVLAAVISGTVLIGESKAPNPRTSALVTSTVVRPTAIHTLTTPSAVFPWKRMLVFYLVSTPAQAANAEWGEQVSGMEAFSLGYVRDYRILLAGDVEQERLAAQAILDVMISLADTARVKVIDFRGLR